MTAPQQPITPPVRPSGLGNSAGKDFGNSGSIPSFSDHRSDETAGQDPDGRGTLGLRPPPSSEVVSVVFDDTSESFSPESAEFSRFSADVAPEATEAPDADPEVPEVLQRLAAVGTDEDPYKDGGPWAYADAEDLGGRVFTITQNRTHPATGAVLMTEEQIAAATARKGVSEFAWVLHDKDVYTAGDSKLPHAQVGAPKADHFHIVIRRKSFATLGVIARLFKVPPTAVEVKPQGAFFDLIEYLTHENPRQVAAGKHRYADEEIHSNIADWRRQLDDHVLARSFRAGKRADAKKLESLMLAVMAGEMTLRQVRLTDPVIYGKNLQAFRRWRADALLHQDPPRNRTNYYIGGAAGVAQLGRTGKSALARLLARALYPELDPEECYFQAVDKRVPFDTYAGQPVIIYDDFSPLDMLQAFGGRTGVWGVLDNHPSRGAVNIKHGHTRLVNAVSIITRTDPYAEYFDALAGAYTDRDGVRHEAEAPEQAWGRFAFASEVTRDMVRVLVSRNAVAGTPEFREFESIARMRIGMRGILEKLDEIDPSERVDAELTVGRRLLGPVLTQHAQLNATGSRSADDVLGELLPVLDGEVLSDPAVIAAADLADELDRWRTQAESERAEWEAKWARAKATPPPGVYDKWLDDYVAWAAKNGGVAEARRRMISGEGPLPPELVQPPESTRYESPRQSGISFDL